MGSLFSKRRRSSAAGVARERTDGNTAVSNGYTPTEIQPSLVTTMPGLFFFKPNTHRRRRRDETVELRRVGGVNTIRN